MRKVASTMLKRGDVFELVDPADDVVGEVFWKHPKSGIIRRMRQKGGKNVFCQIQDMATSIYFQTDFKRAKIKIIGNFQPTHQSDEFCMTN